MFRDRRGSGRVTPRGIMSSARGARGLVCLCLALRVSRVVSEVKSCDQEQFVLSASYDRTSGRTSVGLRTHYLLPAARIEGERLVSPYPWVNVSEMEPERAFATAQVGLLTELAAEFPQNDTISVRYTIGSAMVAIVFRVDGSYAVSDGSSIERVEGIEQSRLDSYARGRNLTAFLASRTEVTNRWRRLCRDTVKFDVPDNASVAFFYRPDEGTFECSVETRVPVEYYLYLTCFGSSLVVSTASDLPDGRISGRLVAKKSGTCEIETANCTVASPYGWATVRKAEVLPGTARGSDPGVNAAVSVTMAILVLGLLVFVYFRYRSFMGPVRDAIALLRERVGYGALGERCTCI